MEPVTEPAAQRRKLLLGGKIVFNNRSSVFDCTVRAVSQIGAELRMRSTLGVPDLFRLTIPSTGETFDCEIVERSETDIGVTFRIGPAPSSPLLRGLSVIR